MPPDPDRPADDLIRAVRNLAVAFDARAIRYALVGGLAVLLRGRPRFTQDVDILLDVPQLVLPTLLDDLTAAGFTLDPAVVIREYVREHMTTFRFGPVRIDWLKPILPLFSRALTDAAVLPWDGDQSLRVATAEGLILTKLVAFRPQDQADIETLLAANRDGIDLSIVRGEWASFAATEPERTEWLEAAITRAGLGSG